MASKKVVLNVKVANEIRMAVRVRAAECGMKIGPTVEFLLAYALPKASKPTSGKE